MRWVEIDQLVTAENFDEAAYLASNPDVAQVVATGAMASGRLHFDQFGVKEGRRARLTRDLAKLRRAKLAKVLPILKSGKRYRRRGDKLDFLTEALRQEAGIVYTHNVSAHAYSPSLVSMIGEYSDGLVLDCGAGLRNTYFENVVNYEIVDFDSTDVLGIGEQLPFADGAFDAVISIAVLEHIRDPSACAAEIARVLKPGGRLICSVPFLQPLHGYPHHYFNMTSQGLRTLFERSLAIDSLSVMPEGFPIWSLTWIIRSWAEGLRGTARDEFLAMRLDDLMRPANEFLDRSWVTSLSAEKNHELAAATLLEAHRPG